MPAKKIGKAKIDLEREVWLVDQKPAAGAFLFNRRLVDTRPEIKAVRSTLGKAVQKNTPPIRKHDKREEYDASKQEYQKQMKEALTLIYSEMLQDSFSDPIPLRMDRDYDHKGDWRFCLYEGIIYQFDRPGYTTDQMLEQITKLGKPKPV
jgi:hypothetical protein